MKNILLLTFAAAVLAGPVQANDKKLEALLDKAFTKEQTRIFKGRDKNNDGKMDRGEFTSLYGEDGAKRWLSVFDKHAGKDKALDLKEFTAVRRDIHLGGGNGHCPVALESRFKHSRQGKMFAPTTKAATARQRRVGADVRGQTECRASGAIQVADGNKDSAWLH